MTEPQARWVDGLCKTCGAYTHSCKCAHPPMSDWAKEIFAAPQGQKPTWPVQQPPGRNPAIQRPHSDGDAPAGAAPAWLDTIPTAADGVTCRIEDVRRAFLENSAARPEEGPYISAYEGALDQFAKALEHAIANPSAETAPPIIKQYADRLRAAETKRIEYDCNICGGIVHGPFIEPTVENIMRGGPHGPRSPRSPQKPTEQKKVPGFSGRKGGIC